MEYNEGYQGICLEIDLEALNESQVVTAIKKRGRGRPKGSKNKAKCSNNSLISVIKSQSLKVPNKRGRPKGSKNRKKKRRGSLFIIILVKRL